MIKSFFRVLIGVCAMIWQVFLFMWLGLNAFGEWLHEVLHNVFNANGFTAKLVILVAAMLFCPFPWWVAFLLIFVPMPIVIPMLVIFYIMFVASFATSIVFV